MAKLKLKTDDTESMPKLCGVSVKHYQPMDCVGGDRQDEISYLDIEVVGDVGAYIVIKTDRWALDRNDLHRLADYLESLLDEFGDDFSNEPKGGTES